MSAPSVRNVPCPLCGSDEATVCAFESSLYLLQPGEEIRRCSSCRFVYLNPRTTADAMRSDWYDDQEYYAYYERGSGTVGYRDDDAAPHLKERLSEIQRLCGSKGRLLEVGSGKGYFLAHAMREGWDVQGVEISSFGVSFSRDRLGVPVIQGTLEEAALAASTYDVIHMNHVLEHVDDLDVFLQEVRRVLRPGGMFVIEVPNQLEHLGYRLRKSLARDLLVRTRKGERNFHTSFFTKRSLRALLDAYGFDVLSMDARTWTASVDARHVAGRWIKKGLYHLENALSQGENILVFARSRNTEQSIRSVA